MDRSVANRIVRTRSKFSRTHVTFGPVQFDYLFSFIRTIKICKSMNDKKSRVKCETFDFRSCRNYIINVPLIGILSGSPATTWTATRLDPRARKLL